MKRTNLLLFTLLSICLCACTQKGNQAESISQEASYPVAEWDKAIAILMHTPGQELFDGVIHPSAGLFENYFDVDKAADEHRGYISALEKNGIKVFTVEQILNETPIEKLREYAKNSLIFDISNIPDANTEENDNYRMKVLGEMSRADLIRCILLQPTVALYPTDHNTGVEAVYTHRPLMNLYFTRDQSLTTPRGHIICQMNSTQRTPETSIIALCYEQLAIKPILEISGEGRIEGGDYIPAGNVSLIGCGMRTNIEAIRQIMNADAFGHDTIAVVRTTNGGKCKCTSTHISISSTKTYAQWSKVACMPKKVILNGLLSTSTLVLQAKRSTILLNKICPLFNISRTTASLLSLSRKKMSCTMPITT